MDTMFDDMLQEEMKRGRKTEFQFLMPMLILMQNHNKIMRQGKLYLI